MIDNLPITGLRVLEIGGADAPLEGAVQVDCVRSDNPDVIHAYWEDELPFDDEEFDLVYSSHCLEHIDWQKTHAALLEAFRVLKPGGWVELWVPDFAYIVRCYHDQTGFDEDWLADKNPHGDFMLWVNARMLSYPRQDRWPDDPNVHRAVFDKHYLRRCLVRAGFVNCERLTHTRTRDHGKIQLGMMGRKPKR